MYFSPEDGSSMFLRNFGVYLQIHTALQPRTLTTTCTTQKCLKNLLIYFGVLGSEYAGMTVGPM
jgi:hypothetical protein